MKAELEVLIDGSEKFAERVFHCEKEDVDYGCAVPLWWAWDSYKEMALKSGFSQETLDMQFLMSTHPGLMLLGCAITGLLAVLGVLFGQRLLRRHFQKAGILE